ncbi:UDP-N-acetylmuramoyl-L-alanyl-D-glutamate--2,6-diaminopimelate ligase [Rhizobium binae]|uniref:UDP-N-acetylmuramoyl-L-alanyl-D-glutamate--2, 6-diaminopimelate ligase n=1 Tax=Rhizobium binae TaxID=1138190 RepID=UPI001C83447B|nr:UDP-N-acetylmuramoyl-L-alanyl-D-glutamate--2,6-diaminopimelate ligase [Rhizobium binae]MBX4962626.1 UDP-N-acetylmuramoyl-L-alanyl-D-glutamate--2,6-diaminopimelate ligase [Rhizobium binae]
MKLRHLLGDDFPEVACLMAGVAGAVEISGVSSDSRKIKPGMLFVALSGAQVDGEDFVGDALRRGASAIVSAQSGARNVPVLDVCNRRRFLALAAARLCEKQPDIVVAATGTAGKTSVVSFTRQIWSRSGHLAAQIGTTGVVSPSRSDHGSRTTPDPVTLHRILSDLEAEGVTHTAMEASSHGLDQCRLDGVRLTAGAFTNLGQDHLDYHSSREDYMAAKMRLFDTLLPKGAPAVIYADDPASNWATKIAAESRLDVRTVGRSGRYLCLVGLEHRRGQQIMKLRFGDQVFEATVPLVGEFQIHNVLVAIALSISTGVPPTTAIAAAEHLTGAAGRLERIGETPEGAPVYVDYAHKPEALEAVLSAVRPSIAGRLILVFGCGGDRDKSKRRRMGEIAAKLSDIVIVTDDNPRSEDPAVIRSEILEAAPGAIEIADRAEAIRVAINMLRKGDSLIVAGKGHEEGQVIGDMVVPYSDRDQVLATLRGRQVQQ